MLVPMRCTDCHDELEHCHGVLVRHGDGDLECIEDADCAGGAPTHGWALDCTEVGCACGDERHDEELVRLAA
jgi:hypothetical protein